MNNMRNKILMTLALLLTAVTGAWAQEETLLLTIESKDYTTFKSGSMTFDDKVTVTFSKSVYNNGDEDGWYTFDEGSLLTVAGTNGYTITSCKFYTEYGPANTGYTVKGESPSVYLNYGEVYTDNSESVYIGNQGIKKIEVYGAAAEPEITEWNLTSKDGKNWILDKMPASNVELQVEYFAESNLFLSKDALADKTSIAVKAGELGVQFGDDGKSANTITEGTEMTVTYNGTKKILGVNVAKKGGEIDPAKAYLKWDDGQKALVATEIPTTFTTVESANASVIWSAGTYVVEGNVTIGGTIALTGDVDLIIKDGAKLTVNNRISGGNKNLSIYGQANQTGQLVVNYSDGDAIRDITKLEVHSCQVTATSSLDNCGGFFIGTFNVYGGSVDAENTSTDEGGYGIWVNGPMNIYGGDVKAVGKGNRPYTYFGITSSSSTVTVYGGKLWAENAANKALNPSVTLKKDAGFSGKIETSDNGTSWGEYTQDTTPGAPYVRVGY